jgi:hypothetical protein
MILCPLDLFVPTSFWYNLIRYRLAGIISTPTIKLLSGNLDSLMRVSAELRNEAATGKSNMQAGARNGEHIAESKRGSRPSPSNVSTQGPCARQILLMH